MKRDEHKMTQLGYILREYRVRHNLTQQELGDRLGVSTNTIHLWETKINLSQLTKVNATANCNFATSQVLDSYVVALLSKFQLQKLVRFLRFPRFLRFVGK